MIDSAVLCHNLWYFPNESAVYSLFANLANSVIARVYVAEWSYTKSNDAQLPHIVASQTRAMFYSFQTPSEPGLREQNVRGGVHQESIVAAAKHSGYVVTKEQMIPAVEGMMGGHFEVEFTLGGVFQQRVTDANLSPEKHEQTLASIE